MLIHRCLQHRKWFINQHQLTFTFWLHHHNSRWIFLALSAHIVIQLYTWNTCVYMLSFTLWYYRATREWFASNRGQLHCNHSAKVITFTFFHSLQKTAEIMLSSMRYWKAEHHWALLYVVFTVNNLYQQQKLIRENTSRPITVPAISTLYLSTLHTETTDSNKESAT